MVTHTAEKQPIIIKRKRVVKGDDHHGGAWKVAYADFVTALMAFFLLLWLLNATTEVQRKGIADYFNPSIPLSRISGGGSEALYGSSIFSEDNTYAMMGTGASRRTDGGMSPETGVKGEAANEKEVATNLQKLKTELNAEGQKLSEHLLIKISTEGIVLEIADSEDTPLFALGRADPSETLITLIGVVSEVFGKFSNDIKIVGHTDNRQFRSQVSYDNWNLSADRANVARHLLIRKGLPASRVREVAGRAYTDPLIPADPSAAQNRRISIIILMD